MNWTDFVQRVPPDVLAHIYEYDDTYRVTAYRRVVAEFHENRWIAWKRSEAYTSLSRRHASFSKPTDLRSPGLDPNHYICRDIVSYRNVLNYVLSETESIDTFEPNINVYAALYDSRVRRLLWHHDPFSTDAYFMYLPNKTPRVPVCDRYHWVQKRLCRFPPGSRGATSEGMKPGSVREKCRLLFFDPSHPEETEQASFVMRIGDEYRMEGTIMSERCHQSVWKHDREYPSPRIQDSITVFQDELYRILLHL